MTGLIDNVIAYYYINNNNDSLIEHHKYLSQQYQDRQADTLTCRNSFPRSDFNLMKLFEYLGKFTF